MTTPIWGFDNNEWVHVRHYLTVWDRNDLRVWLNENIEGNYRINASHIYFERDVEATLFRLKYK